MRRLAMLALIGYAAVLGAFGVFIGIPFLTEERDIPAEVPSPSALFFTSLDVVPGGGRLCMTDVTITKQTAHVRYQIGTYKKPGPPLELTIRGDSYSARVAERRGYKDNAIHAVAIPKPPRDQLVTVCIRNRGRSKIAFYAAADRAISRVNVFVDHERVVPTPSLSFHERAPVSLADRAGVTAARIATFRGFLGHTWMVWVLAILFAIGVPVLMGVALRGAARRP